MRQSTASSSAPVAESSGGAWHIVLPPCSACACAQHATHNQLPALTQSSPTVLAELQSCCAGSHRRLPSGCSPWAHCCAVTAGMLLLSAMDSCNLLFPLKQSAQPLLNSNLLHEQHI